MESDFHLIFDTFKQVASMNDKNLSSGLGLVARPVFIVPTESYELVLRKIFYPNKLSKVLYKLGFNTEDGFQKIDSNGREFKPSLPFSVPSLSEFNFNLPWKWPWSRL